jgi:hypothetical protein
MNFDPAILARIQFAFTVSFHIIGLDVRQTGPCGRPGGRVPSVSPGAIACFRSASSPVFQNS